MSWCTVLVKDLEKSLKFYGEVLGLQVQRRYKTPEDLEIAFLSDGIMSEVELIHNPRVPSYEGRGVTLGFVVDSLEQEIERFGKLGIEIIKGPIEVGGGVKFFYVLDPNGLEIQLVEMGK